MEDFIYGAGVGVAVTWAVFATCEEIKKCNGKFVYKEDAAEFWLRLILYIFPAIGGMILFSIVLIFFLIYVVKYLLF